MPPKAATITPMTVATILRASEDTSIADIDLQIIIQG